MYRRGNGRPMNLVQLLEEHQAAIVAEAEYVDILPTRECARMNAGESRLRQPLPLGMGSRVKDITPRATAASCVLG